MATASADAPLKGLRFLLKAYARLLERYPRLELVVVGKPSGDIEVLPRDADEPFLLSGHEGPVRAVTPSGC